MQSNFFSNIPVTDPAQPAGALMVLGIEHTWRPVRTWNLGLPQSLVSNQVNQVRSAVVGSPATPQVNGNAQGVAQPVQNLRVTRSVISATQVKVSIAFTPAQNDRYFQGVSVNLAQGLGSPAQVISGRQSPISFVLTRTSAASSITVQSLGSLGDTAVGSGGISPGRFVPLR